MSQSTHHYKAQYIHAENNHLNWVSFTFHHHRIRHILSINWKWAAIRITSVQFVVVTLKIVDWSKSTQNSLQNAVRNNFD